MENKTDVQKLNDIFIGPDTPAVGTLLRFRTWKELLEDPSVSMNPNGKLFVPADNYFQFVAGPSGFYVHEQWELLGTTHIVAGVTPKGSIRLEEVKGWWNHISKLFTTVGVDKALPAEPVTVTIDMVNWCYPGDVNLWHSGYASAKGDYTSVEWSVVAPQCDTLFSVCADQVCASMIYAAMMHMPVLTSFIDSWTCVMADKDGLLTFRNTKPEPGGAVGRDEYANCKYSGFIADFKTSWSRTELEDLWADMGPRPLRKGVA